MKGLVCLPTRQRWHQVIYHANCFPAVHPIIPAKHVYSKLCSLLIDERRFTCAAAQLLALRYVGMRILMQR